MKIFYTILLAALLSLSNYSCYDVKSDEHKSPESIESLTTPHIEYDSLLAQKLGADEYGMKKYVMAFLKMGPNAAKMEDAQLQLQMAHLKNIIRMADEGKLAVAGPFMDDGDIKGIYIFNTESLDTAMAWTSTDPAVIAGRFVMELHPWYGSAAMLEVNQLHKRLEKKSILN